jgi:glycosyltransferase involved in cell wall biosynthesis
LDESIRSVLVTADTVGGVWTYAIELVRALQAQRVHATIAAIGRITAEQREEARGLEVRERPFKLEWMDDPWDDVRASGEWLLELCGELRPDAIHLDGYAHASLPWPLPPLVAGHSSVFGWFAAVRGRLPPPSFDRYREEVRSGLRAAGLVVAPTWAMLAELRRFYGPVPYGRVIPNARDPKLFASAPYKEPIVLAAGRLWDEAKNLRVLDAAAEHCDWPVFVAGDAQGPQGGEVRAAHAKLLGRLPRERLAHWMGRAAIYALPALYEPFGLSVLEAALSGCALVLGAIDSLREIWAGAAVFVDPRDPEALAAALRRLVRDASARERLGLLARGRAVGMRPERMARQYVRAYAELSTRRAEAVA